MDAPDFNIKGFGNISIKPIVIDKDESLWDKLIQQIMEGNVIPVIGPDMLIDSPTNLHQLVIDFIANTFQMQSHPQSFSELIFDDNFLKYNKNRDQIYFLVNQIFEGNKFPPSVRLKRLLSIRQFPFVITTSFTPVVEDCMRSVWGDELSVMSFNNNPNLNDDIKISADMRKPTVYYMFGKVGGGAQRYVLTDSDMLAFVSSWLSNDSKARPKNLCGELEDKYLLMLGTDYANWLFRFIWYSMRKHDNLGNGMLAYETLDDSLVNFLERAETFTKQNTSDVIDQIVTRLDKKLKEHEKTKFDMPEDNMDVFISYSRSDADIAEKLYNALTAQGKRVWYDKKNLTDGGRFMEEIHQAIRTAKYFIPILSDNIEKEKNDPHVYRDEWNQAIEVGSMMGRTYIIPIAEKNFDFYRAAIPERLQRHNAIFFDRNDDITAVAEKIIHKMNES